MVVMVLPELFSISRSRSIKGMLRFSGISHPSVVFPLHM